MKRCKICDEQKPLTDYYKNHGRCKRCYLDTLIAKRKPGDTREKNLRHFYGIGVGDYNEMLEFQEHKCALCESTEPGGRKSGRGGAVKHFFVDHCHNTGKIRGLLCNNCNRGLGLLGDNVESLQKAIRYLQQ